MMANEFDVVIDDVRVRSYVVEGQDAMLLVAYLGDVAPEDRVSVCETLLAIQLAAWDEPMIRFGMHPLDEALVLCAHVPMDETIDREKLTGLVNSVVAQVLEWREVHLAGKVSMSPLARALPGASANVVDVVLHA